MYRLLFELDGLPKMPNELLGAHWRVRSKNARMWKHSVWLTTANRRPVAPLKRALLTLTRYSSVEPDSDGLRGSFKPILDALVHCGILVNDKPENVGEPVVRHEKCPPKMGKIQIIVEEIV